jgi:tRNA pseudouridine38/39 synthase
MTRRGIVGRFLRPRAYRFPMAHPSSYDNWTREELIARLRELDRRKTPRVPRKEQSAKPFDFSIHPQRKIALKFSYSGSEYGGLAFQNGPTPLPTVEEVLFNAMARTWLVDPDGGLAGCGWERCGRTDRGVSAAGQVVSVWVRTGLEDRRKATQDDRQDNGDGLQPSLDPSKPELPYVSMLNRVLPHTIRVLAWSPVLPAFSARFACKYRHYKYLFSSDGLDLSLMQNAADRLVGEHDFRNLCKLDAAKQITNFKREILQAKINPVGDTWTALANGTLFVFDIVGSAFLYHQVRHIVAILFLVGTGLEHPSVVSSLLNVDPDHPIIPKGDPTIEVVDSKPEYQMADSLPLMLWDCGYADSEIRWRVNGNGEEEAQQDGAGTNPYSQLQSLHSRSLIYAAVDAHFVEAAARYHPTPPPYFPFSQTGLTPSTKSDRQGPMNVPLGGGTFKRTAKYVPLLRRTRLDNAEVANKRWRVGKGSRKAAFRQQ